MENFDFEDAKVYKKGTIVFGRCDNDLPWPAKITRVLKKKYAVRFINDKSTAVLEEHAVFNFEDEIIKQVLEEYQNHGKPSDKVFQAIQICKHEIESLRKKEEKQCLTNAEKKAKKKDRDHESSETSLNARAGKSEDCLTKSLKKISKVKAQDYTSNQSESDLARQYTLEGACEGSKMLTEAFQEMKKENAEMRNEIPYISDEEKVEAPQPLPTVLEQEKVEEKTNSTVPEHAATSNVVSEPFTENWSLNLPSTEAPILHSVEAPKQNSVFNPVRIEINNKTTMETEDDRFDFLEEDEQKKKTDMICMYLGKMTDYLTGKNSVPLQKDEKLDLAMLLEDYRKYYYDPVLLECMVRFVKAFDFKLKDQRKNCIIDYLKIKERLDTACFLRTKLSYDSATIQILNRYTSRENLHS